MANEGNVGISATLNDDGVLDAIDRVVKAVEKGTDKIAVSVDAMVDKMEKGFGNVVKSTSTMVDTLNSSISKIGQDKSGVDALAESLNKVGESKDFDKLSEDAKNAFKDTKMLADEIDVLKKKLSEIPTGKRTSSPIMTTEQAVNVSKTDISQLNLPQLQEFVREATKAKKILTDTKNLDAFKNVSLSAEQAKIKIKALNDEIARQAKKTQIAPDLAFNMSENSIAERTAKISALKQVQANLSREDANYEAQLKKTNKALFDLNEANKKAMSSGINLENQQKRMGITMEALTRRMAYYLSVDALMNFSKNLVTIRGEFELQNKSLAAIIQNKDEADRLFARITALAVQSPFQLVELVSYTKQLAAYRVETEKLYDTTKMLADVSAGVGTSMDRLILAYGQVKSAAVLRGQELRQFTEAGLPIIDQLAQKFSELEGRAVSAGEVFEKVSNRMVSFKMVDEIFKDMTQSGGVFYNMQELQAETLKGKVSNLVDAYQVMLNKIGEGNEGALKAGVDSLRYVLDNYEEFITILKELIVVFGIYKTVSFGLSKLNLTMAASADEAAAAYKNMNTKVSLGSMSSLSNVTRLLSVSFNGLKAAVKSAGSALLSFLPYAIIFGVIELSKYLYNAATAASKLKKELDGFATEGILEADRLSNRFEALATKAKNAADGSEEQREALRKLQSAYKDILPAQSLTIEGLRNMKDGYKSVTDAIYAKVKAQQEEKGLTFITTELEPKAQESFQILRDNLKDIGNDADLAAEALRIFRARIESGTLDLKNVKNAKDALGEISKIYMSLSGRGITYEAESFFSKGTNTLANEYLSTILKIKRSTDDLNNSLNASFAAQGKYTQQFANAKEEAKRLGEEAAKSATEVGKSKFEIDREQLKAEREYLLNWAASLGVATREQLNKAISEGTPLNVSDVAFIGVFNSIQKEVATTTEKLSGIPRSVAEIIDKIPDLTGEVKLDFISQIEGKSADEFIASLQGQVASYTDQIKLYSSILAVATPLTIEYYNAQNALADAQSRLSIVTKLLNALNQPLKKGETSDKKDKELERVKKQISLINDLRGEYEKLTKAGYTAAEAQEVLNGQFGKKMISLLPNLDVKQVASSTDKQAAEIVDGLAKGIKSKAASMEIDATVSKFTLSAAVEVKMDLNQALEDELSKIQQDYEIGIEIEGMGASGSLFAQMFDYNPATLEQTVNRINAELQKIGGKDAQKLSFDEFIGLKGFDKDSDLYKKIKAFYDFRDKIQQDDFKKTIEWQEKLLSKYSEFAYKQAEIDRTAKEEQAALDKMFAGRKTSAEYGRLSDAIEKKRAQESAKISFEEFKGSDEWIKAFEDLDKISTASIERIISKMNEFKSAQGRYLSPTELREYTNTMQKLEDQLIQRNPFKTLANSIKDLKKVSSQIDLAKATAGFEGSNEDFRIEINKKIKQSEEDITSAREKGGAAVDVQVASQKAIISQLLQTLGLLDQEEAKRNTLNDSIRQGASDAKAVLDSALSMMDDLGVQFSDDIKARLEGLGQILEGISSIDITKPMSIITGTFSVIGGIAKTIFGEGRNAKITKAIEKSKEAVERLETAYMRLEHAAKKAMGTEETVAKQALIANLKLQEAEIKRQLELEKSRKKKDRDQSVIEGYEQQLVSIQNEIADATEAIVSDLLGSDLKGAAEDFADAFISAWREGEDAMEALSEKFDSMIQNMIVKSLASKIVAKRLESIFKMVDDATKKESEGGESITEAELKRVSEAGKGLVSNINKDLTDLMGALGIGFGEGTKESLSNLQKGIQGITEETATALESLFNSFLYQATIQSGLLSNMNIYVELTSINTSQMLLYSQQTYQLLQQMRLWQESITFVGHKQGGAGLKVFID